jgi:hypothetical protein
MSSRHCSLFYLLPSSRLGVQGCKTQKAWEQELERIKKLSTHLCSIDNPLNHPPLQVPKELLFAWGRKHQMILPQQREEVELTETAGMSCLWAQVGRPIEGEQRRWVKLQGVYAMLAKQGNNKQTERENKPCYPESIEQVSGQCWRTRKMGGKNGRRARTGNPTCTCFCQQVQTAPRPEIQFMLSPFQTFQGHSRTAIRLLSIFVF